jgi:RimJ/RimL family protein N-acetyltransferase
MTQHRLDERYPRKIDTERGAITLRVMTPADEGAVLNFARSLPPHDLLFLRRDITNEKVLSAWVRQLEAGEITSLLAFDGDEIVGCTAVVTDAHSWSPHLGELRVLLAPRLRERGLGRTLIQECFIVALIMKLEKLCAQMTADQQGAIAVFEGMGFRPEALLKDHVKDTTGEKHDIVILSHDVAEFAARMEAFGLTNAF